MRMCQCLPPKLVTSRLHLPDIEEELIQTDDIFKVVEEGVTDFVGCFHHCRNSPFLFHTIKLLVRSCDHFWKWVKLLSTYCACGAGRPVLYLWNDLTCSLFLGCYKVTLESLQTLQNEIKKSYSIHRFTMKHFAQLIARSEKEIF